MPHALVLFICAFGMTALFAAYLFLARKRWKRIIRSALGYHVAHFNDMLNDNSVPPASKEICRIMNRVIERQLVIDGENGVKGMRGILRTFLGHHTSLKIAWEAYFKIIENRVDADGIIPRLLNTLISTLTRHYLLDSICSIAALPLYDMRLFLYYIRPSRSGPAALFQNIYFN